MKKADAVAAGRTELAKFFEKAEKTGEILYMIPSVSRSGMSRRIQLFVCETTRTSSRDTKPRPTLTQLWPALDDATLQGGWDEHSAALKEICKDWGFSFDKRAFTVHGCGMDMVFWLIDHLAHKAGIRDDVANRIQRNSIG